MDLGTRLANVGQVEKRNLPPCPPVKISDATKSQAKRNQSTRPRKLKQWQALPGIFSRWSNLYRDAEEPVPQDRRNCEAGIEHASSSACPGAD